MKTGTGLVQKTITDSFFTSGSGVEGYFPHSFHITPWMSWSASGGETPVRAANTNNIGLGFLTNGNGANLDYFEFNFEGEAGTWSIRFGCVEANNFGIIDVTIDSVPVVTVDGYDAGTLYTTTTTTGIAIATSGNHTIRFAIDGKNASSADWLMRIPFLSGVRTGA